MGRRFLRTSNEYGDYNGAIITGLPFSVGVLIQADSFGRNNTRIILEIRSTVNANNYHRLQILSPFAPIGGACYYVRAWSRAVITMGVATTGILTGGYSDWHLIAANFNSTTSRWALGMEMGNISSWVEQQNTTSVNPNLAGPELRVARGGSNYWSGNMEWIAIWDQALDRGEWKAIGMGVPPHKIRPQDLVGCWPMWGLASPEPDIVANHALTLYNTPAADIGAPVMPARPFGFVDA